MRLSLCQYTAIRALELTPSHIHRLITITVTRLADKGTILLVVGADDSHHEIFAIDTKLPEMQSDEYEEDYHREKTIEYCGFSIDEE